METILRKVSWLHALLDLNLSGLNEVCSTLIKPFGRYQYRSKRSQVNSLTVTTELLVHQDQLTLAFGPKGQRHATFPQL